MTFDVLITNWNRLCEENPEIRESIKEGYEVSAYDEETQMIICVGLEDGSLKMKIVEDAYVIEKKKVVKPHAL